MTDDVKMPPMDAAMLTALTPSLQPTGEHKALPDGYCPDCCGAPCLYRASWVQLDGPCQDADCHCTALIEKRSGALGEEGS